MNKQNAARQIIEALMLLEKPNHQDVNQAKLKVAAEKHLQQIPSNAELISALKPEEKRLLQILKRKTIRTISGVTVVAVMTKPQPCPQPEPCGYCPGGPTQGAPQSYTGHEPAAMRGAENKYDPYMQVRSRIDQLSAIGHRVDKVELIIMGGTFPATPIGYQKWFIRRCLDALALKLSVNLEEAKTNAENCKPRNVGITVETRPDWAKQPHIDNMLEMGVTRVELGVQNPDDAIYRFVGRTHTVEDVKEATQIAKDAGLKTVYHMMPGMPGSNPAKDLETFRQVFNDPSFKPDMLKIYPCLVIKGTKTYEWYKQGTYKPYSTEEAATLIAEIKKMVPPWIRIMRIQRDIPAQLITAGVDKSNLRQLVKEKLLKQGHRCGCIRCREVGHRAVADGVTPELNEVKVNSMEYAASEGKEIFLSAEDRKNNVLIGYLRMRIPSAKAHRVEITASSSAVVRELHVYGPLVPVGAHMMKAWQHKGYGKILLSTAERIAIEDYDLKKLLVISALGTKQYYMRLNYSRDGVYVSKKLRD